MKVSTFQLQNNFFWVKQPFFFLYVFHVVQCEKCDGILMLIFEVSLLAELFRSGLKQ